MENILNKPLEKYSFEDEGFASIATEIQGNILKSHGRGHTSHIFFQFNKSKVIEAKQFIRTLGNKYVFSAKDQKEDTDKFKDGSSESTVFITFYLGKKGYDYLGFSAPDGLKEMKDITVQQRLQDPPISFWEEGFQEEIHGMVLLAEGTSTDDVTEPILRKSLEAKTSEILNLLNENGLAKILTIERGDGIKRKNTDDDIEHFGYVDGISQPKFFKEEEPSQPQFWTQLMNPSLVLVEDPNVQNNENALGSFLVFRKLEQNVKGFKLAEKKLAKEFGFKGEKEELAGAMVVGRFENGMPVTIHDEDLKPPVLVEYNVGKFNNFNYDDDSLGAKCPFHAHVRKSNPRGETQIFGVTDEEKKSLLEIERSHTMARRGIIYGKRNKHPNEEPIEDMPEAGVGLLFMSFQSSIENQFEFIQSDWVNNPHFIHGRTGLDPIIGQGTFEAEQKYPTRYGDHSVIKSSSPFGGFVTLKGGEYFFAPSMAFLKSII